MVRAVHRRHPQLQIEVHDQHAEIAYECRGQIEQHLGLPIAQDQQTPSDQRHHRDKVMYSERAQRPLAWQQDGQVVDEGHQQRRADPRQQDREFGQGPTAIGFCLAQALFFTAPAFTVQSLMVQALTVQGKTIEIVHAHRKGSPGGWSCHGNAAIWLNIAEAARWYPV